MLFRVLVDLIVIILIVVVYASGLGPGFLMCALGFLLNLIVIIIIVVVYATRLGFLF